MHNWQDFQIKQPWQAFSSGNSGFDQYNLAARSLPILTLQQENVSAESPTLTASSDKSEITDVSTDFSFIGGRKQVFADRQWGITQQWPMQQAGYNDMQLLQQQIMLKQLQQLQRQQQLQPVADVRQQNTAHPSLMTNQAAVGSLSPLINGTPVHDTSPILMNWVQRGAPTTLHGASPRVSLSQEQGQNMRSGGLLSQQLDASFYGNPMTRSNLIQNSLPGWNPPDSVNLWTKSRVDQLEKPVMQPPVFTSSLLGDQFSMSSDQGSVHNSYASQKEFQGKNIFGQLPNQLFNGETLAGRDQQNDAHQANMLMQAMNEKQEQVDSHENLQQNLINSSAPQELVPLDPIEKKILYNMDDSPMDALFGSTPSGIGGFGNSFDQGGSAFSSLQSGSWSALMQSAVAEASSSDTGVQEDWSGLTFHNTELSSDNPIEKQQIGLVENNAQNASTLNSKAFPIFNNPTLGSSFSGFQPSNINFPPEHRDTPQDESIQKHPRRADEWSDPNTPQKLQFDGNQHVQPPMQLNSWPDLSQKPSGKDPSQQIISPYTDTGALYTQQKGQDKEAPYLNIGPNSSLWKADGNYGVGRTKSTGEQERLQSGKNNVLLNMDGSGLDKLASVQNSRAGMIHQGSDQLSQDNFSPNSAGYVDTGGESKQHNFMSPRQNYASQQYDQASGLDKLASVQNSRAGMIHQGSNQLSQDNFSPNSAGYVDTGGESKQHNFMSPRQNYASQQYDQASASQGFGLRLAPPSQGPPNSSLLISSEGPSHSVNSPGSTQESTELGDKRQTWPASPSFQSFPPLQESSQRGPWDIKSSAPEQGRIDSSVNMQRKFAEALLSCPPHLRNQLQSKLMSKTTALQNANQLAKFPTIASRYPAFNVASLQDVSRQINSSALAQQYPVLESVAVSQNSSMPSASQQDGFLARPHSTQTNIPPKQHSSSVEPQSPSSDLSKHSVEKISVASEGLNHQNSQMVGFSPEAQSMNLFSNSYNKGKESFQQQASSEISGSPRHGDLRQGQDDVKSRFSDANASSSLSHYRQHNMYQAQNASLGHVTSEKAMGPFSPLDLSCPVPQGQSQSLLHQMQAMKYGETDINKMSNIQQMAPLPGLHSQTYSRITNRMDGVLNSVSQLNSSQAVDNKVTELKEDERTLALPQTSVSDGQPSQEASCAVSNGISSSHVGQAHSRVNMMTPLFNQSTLFRNGQRLPLPIFNSGLAKNAMEQMSLRKLPPNLFVQASVDKVNCAEASVDGSGIPNDASSLVEKDPSMIPHVLDSHAVDQISTIVRPKKRKSSSADLLPWHKEVMQGIQELQHIGVAEEEWAKATNRLIEKVGDGMMEDGHPKIRAKRRVLLTTQLMQQLLRAVPGSFLLANASLTYDSLVYFSARIALGDACSLSCNLQSDLHLLSKSSNIEKLETDDKTHDDSLAKVVESLSGRAKKYEDDFQRLEKTASFSDIRFECLELEKFSVINRFAKFHNPRPADASATPSSSSSTPMTAPRPLPQRYVMALPMPRNLPEGVQCLSL